VSDEKNEPAPADDRAQSHWGRVFDLRRFDAPVATPVAIPVGMPTTIPAAEEPESSRRHVLPRIICVDYCREQCNVLEVDNVEDFLAHHRPSWSEVRWIHIAGASDPAVVRAFGEKYELHPLAVEDVLNGDQRPKAEDFPFSQDHPGRLFIIARAVARKGQHVETEQVSFFLGRKTLVSFEEKDPDLFIAVEGRIRDPNSRLRQHDVSFLLYCLIDHLVDSFFPILEEISTNLDDIEAAVLDNRGRNVLPNIYRFRRDLSLLRRVAWPMRELIFKLHRETHVCLSETTATYLRDVYDHLVQVQDLLETYREFADSLAQTNMSLASNRMNDIMKTLTIVSTIFVPLTFLAGVYGMNFRVNFPELDWPWSYPVFWGICLAAAGGMLYMFRRRKWI
jgi:magnesium transporter